MRDKLDADEQRIEDHLTDAAFQSVPDIERRIAQARKLALQTTKKNKSITIRVSESDLQRIKRIAANEGIPYQTLITGLLHQYASDGTQPSSQP